MNGTHIPPNVEKGSSPDAPIPAWAQPLARISAVLFLISSVFPIAASLSKDTSAYPKWWGVLDVSLAFLLAILAFIIYGLASNKVNQSIEAATYRAYRILIHVIFVLLLIFFLAGDRITWINGLPGIAWRAWLLLYILPAWFTLAQTAPS